MPPILNDVKARPGLPYGFPVITRLSWEALEKQRRGERGRRERRAFNSWECGRGWLGPGLTGRDLSLLAEGNNEEGRSSRGEREIYDVQ